MEAVGGHRPQREQTPPMQPRPVVAHKAQDQERCALVTRNFGSEPSLSALQQGGCVCTWERMGGRMLVLGRSS